MKRVDFLFLQENGKWVKLTRLMRLNRVAVGGKREKKLFGEEINGNRRVSNQGSVGVVRKRQREAEAEAEEEQESE